MGVQVTAICECGLNTDVQIGGGMFDFTTMCHFPCICNSCRNLVEANLLEKGRTCPHCNSHDLIPYNDQRLIGTAGNRTVTEWSMEDSQRRELVLTNGTYKCPKCGKMSLRFAGDSVILWD